MYRCLSSVLLLFLSAAALAQKPQPPSGDELAAIATRAASCSMNMIKLRGTPRTP
jgi:hypothetical protein